MSKINFEISKNNTLTAKGNLLSAVNYSGGKDLVLCLKASLNAFHEIETQYFKAMANDMKLVGSERSDILLQVDTFFNLLILLWVLISNENDDQQLIYINETMSDTKISITINHEQWIASGTVSDLLLKPAANFSDTYRNELAPTVTKFLIDYKQAAMDNVLNDSERSILNQDLNNILYTTLYLRFQLDHCLISN